MEKRGNEQRKRRDSGKGMAMETYPSIIIEDRVEN